MASTKTSVQAMADLIGITVTEFRRKYRKELSHGHEYVYAHISLSLVNDAMLKGDIRAKLAWLRKFGGWEEVTRRELTGKNGEPISIRQLDTPSLLAIAESLSKASRPGRGAGRTQTTIDGEITEDLDPVPGSADEGAGE